MARDAGPVLIVDDDEDTRAFLQLTFGLLGFPVVTAVDGEDGLAVAKAQRPCLILLDVMMPRMDGFAFREAQLATPELADTPVIVISAVQDETQLRNRMGPVPAVPKPIELDELIERVAPYCTTPAA